MWGDSSGGGQTESPDVGSLCEEKDYRRGSVVLSLAARASVVQATPVCDWLSTSLAREAESGEGWREELASWRAGRAPGRAPGWSCVSYVGAPVLEASGNVLRQRIRFGVSEPPFRSWRRGEVSMWSKASRRRLRLTLHRVKWSRHASAWVVVTLTLPGKDVEVCMDGRQVHRWRRAFLRRWRRDFGRSEYAWKLEFQRRGAAHFAVVLPLPSANVQQPNDLAALRAWVAQAWYEVVGSGSVTHLRAGTQTAMIRDLRALRSYIVGELVKGRKSKEYQHILPTDYKHVGRWWGVSRGLCEPWSAWGQSERQAYATRRVLARSVRSPGYRQHMRRSMRKRVSTSTVFVGEDAVSLAWRLQELRQ